MSKLFRKSAGICVISPCNGWQYWLPHCCLNVLYFSSSSTDILLHTSCQRRCFQLQFKPANDIYGVYFSAGETSAYKTFTNPVDEVV